MRPLDSARIDFVHLAAESGGVFGEFEQARRERSERHAFLARDLFDLAHGRVAAHGSAPRGEIADLVAADAERHTGADSLQEVARDFVGDDAGIHAISTARPERVDS